LKANSAALLADLYERHDGLTLFRIVDDPEAFGFRLPSLVEAAALTEDMCSGSLSEHARQLGLPYPHGEYRVIAIGSDEDTRFCWFTAGKHNGVALTDKVYYFSLDPTEDMETPLADSAAKFLTSVLEQPMEFLENIFFDIEIPGGDGETVLPPFEYVADWP